MIQPILRPGFQDGNCSPYFSLSLMQLSHICWNIITTLPCCGCCCCDDVSWPLCTSLVSVPENTSSSPGRHSEEVMTASPSRHYWGHCKAAEEDSDPETHGKGIWTKICGRLASGTAARRWRWQYRTQLDEFEWSVTQHPLGATRQTIHNHRYIPSRYRASGSHRMAWWGHR